MSEVWNVGKDVISAYLSGLQHKERREALVNQALYRQQQMQIAQEKIEDARKKFNEEINLKTKEHLSKATLRDVQAKAADAKTIADRDTINLNVARFLNNPSVVAPDGRRIQLNLPGQAKPVQLQTGQERVDQDVNKQVRIAQGQEDVRAPGRQEDIRLRGNIDAANDAANKAADAVEKEKDRQNRLATTNIRANATYARQNATKQEKDAEDQDAIDKHLPDILSGQTTLEDLASLPAQTRLKVVNAARTNGGRIFKNKDKEKFNEIPEVFNFLDNARALKDAYNNYNLNDARGIDTRIQPALGLFGRNALAEKGNLSNQDVNRVGKLLPSFWLTKEQNEKNVQEIENIIHNKMDQTLRGLNPVQRKIVEERWGIRARPNKDTKGDEWVPKQ